MKKKMKKTTRTAGTEAIAPRSIRRLFPHVKTVVDAEDPIEVDVTPADCEHAVSRNPNECALARALKREYRADAAIIVVSSSFLIKKNKCIRYATGEHIARELVSFDRHRDFEPGHYTLRPQRPSERMEVRNERDRDRRATKKDTRPRHDTHPPRVVGTARTRLLTSKQGVR